MFFVFGFGFGFGLGLVVFSCNLVLDLVYFYNIFCVYILIYMIKSCVKLINFIYYLFIDLGMVFFFWCFLFVFYYINFGNIIIVYKLIGF